MNKILSVVQAFREHILNAGSFVVLRIISLALFFFTTPFFISRAGSEAYGRLTLLLLLFNFVGYLDLGTGYALHMRYTRALIRARSALSRYRMLSRATSFYYIMFWMAIVPVLIFSEEFSLLLFSSPDYSLHLKLVGICLGFMLLDSFLGAILKAHNRIYQTNIALFLFDVFRNAALLVGGLSQGNLLQLMYVITGGTLVKFLYSLSSVIGTEKTLSWLWPQLNRRDFWLNFRFGLPVFGTSVLGIAIHNIDKIVIGKFLHLEGLGYYAIAADVNTKAWFLVFAINSSLYTVFVRRHSQQLTIRPLMLVSFSGIFLVSLFYYLPLSLWAEPLLTFWIDPEVTEHAAPLVRLHAIASILYLCTAVLYGLLQSQGKGQRLFWIYAFSALWLLFLFQILPVQAGIAGYAWCYILLYGTMFALMLFALFWRSVPRATSRPGSRTLLLS
ncbi:MAG: oligosaccharide flippase family protein [Spirochaetales bacterium]|nr:oligosaccharide flippase family protein [Spirochaetales bacterium]